MRIAYALSGTGRGHAGRAAALVPLLPAGPQKLPPGTPQVTLLWRGGPGIVALLGARRAQFWSGWWRRNVSGLAANVSLGMMLGLVPALVV